MHKLIGEHFVNLKDLSFEQAEHVLKVQKKNRKRKFREIAVELGFLKPKKLDNCLEQPSDDDKLIKPFSKKSAGKKT